MNSFCKGAGAFLSHHRRALMIVFCWCVGLFAGVLFADINSLFFLPWMRSAVMLPVSIVGLFVSIFLPLITLFIRRLWLILFVCFYKAFSFGFICTLLGYIFRGSAWLICPLFLFSDCVSLFVLMDFWLRTWKSSERLSMQAYVRFLICLLASGIDYLFISPFLMGLF